MREPWQLLEPVDVSMFGQFNKTVSELNADGESLTLVDENFSVSTQHEMLSTCITRIHALNEQAASQATFIEILSDNLSKLPDFKLALNKFDECKQRLEKLSKVLGSFQQFHSLQASHSKLITEQLTLKQHLDFLNEVIELSKDFFNFEAEIAKLTEEQSSLNTKNIDETALLAGFKTSLSLVDENLTTTDNRSQFLRSTLDGCSSIYSEITSKQAQLPLLHQKIAENESSLNLCRNLHDSTQTELITISGLRVTEQTLLTSDLSALDLDKFKLAELSRISEELNSWKVHDEAVQKTQISLAEQMGVHERLITAGLDYLSIWPTSICPLCNKQHDSELVLREKVEHSNLLSVLSKDNSAKLEVSNKQQSILKEQMQAIVQQAIQVQMERLTALRARLNDLGVQLTKLEQQKLLLQAEVASLQSQIKSLQLSVWDLPRDELISRSEIELKELAEKQILLLSNKTALSQSIEAKKELIAQLESSMQMLGFKIQATSSGSTYQKVKAYLQKSGLASPELIPHCAEMRTKIETQMEQLKTDASKIDAQAKAIQESLIASGSWVDNETLSAEKGDVESQLVKSELVIQTFLVSLNRVIGSQDGKSVDQIEVAITEAIDRFRTLYERTGSKIKKFELLSELFKATESYLACRALQDDLAKTEKKIVERERVEKALVAERETVIMALKRLIKAFFHEDLIDSIYKKIDPHPSLKKVEFRPDFEMSDRPGLNIVLSDGVGNAISPLLFLAQRS